MLKQLVEFVPAHLKNTQAILESIETGFPSLSCPEDMIMAPLDDKAQYPSIPIKDGTEQSERYWHLKDIGALRLLEDTIMECLSFILHNNIFKFGKDVYRQISGIAMGSSPVINHHVYAHTRGTWTTSFWYGDTENNACNDSSGNAMINTLILRLHRKTQLGMAQFLSWMGRKEETKGRWCRWNSNSRQMS